MKKKYPISDSLPQRPVYRSWINPWVLEYLLTCSRCVFCKSRDNLLLQKIIGYRPLELGNCIPLCWDCEPYIRGLDLMFSIYSFYNTRPLFFQMLIENRALETIGLYYSPWNIDKHFPFTINKIERIPSKRKYFIYRESNTKRNAELRIRNVI